MRPRLLGAVSINVLCTIFLATGCGSSSAHIRLLNAIPIPSSLDMLIDGKNVASSIPYGAASGYISVASGSRHLQIETTGSTPFVDETVKVSGNVTVLDTTSGATVLTDNNSAPASGDASIRIVNASFNIGTVDVYIVTSGTAIGTTPTFSSLGVGSASTYDAVAAASYQIFFTQPGTQNVLLSTNTLSFASGQVRTVVALDGQTGGVTTSVLADVN